jgi:hypothetical protein
LNLYVCGGEEIIRGTECELMGYVAKRSKGDNGEQVQGVGRKGDKLFNVFGFNFFNPFSGFKSPKAQLFISPKAQLNDKNLKSYD